LAEDLGLGASAFSPKKDDDESSEDEVPLAVRHPASRLSSYPTADAEDEDDKPLGTKYGGSVAGGSVSNFQQQQLLQQQHFMQQQMLQQQIMLQTQAQLRASMAFGGAMMNPSMMGSPFVAPFAPTMSMHSLNLNPAVGMAQGAEPSQNSRVDQWRRDVVQ